MSNQQQCIDFYGERLKVGDKVIPMFEEALFIGIGGVISKIEYNEKYDNHYITITDNDGKVLLDGVDARCYTTQARYDERDKWISLVKDKIEELKKHYNTDNNIRIYTLKDSYELQATVLEELLEEK